MYVYKNERTCKGALITAWYLFVDELLSAAEYNVMLILEPSPQWQWNMEWACYIEMIYNISPADTLMLHKL